MFSEKVCGDVNFIFLIDEDDVIVGYVVFVGCVDFIQFYYLMSCGIVKEEVECLVIYGFFVLVVNEFLIEGVKK